MFGIDKKIFIFACAVIVASIVFLACLMAISEVIRFVLTWTISGLVIIVISLLIYINKGGE